MTIKELIEKLQAAIAGGIPEDAPPAGTCCLGVTASMDSYTHIITGSGFGSSDATLWRVIRVSDDAVMQSGSGAFASFAFVGEPGVEYQLQFM